MISTFNFELKQLNYVVFLYKKHIFAIVSSRTFRDTHIIKFNTELFFWQLFCLKIFFMMLCALPQKIFLLLVYFFFMFSLHLSLKCSSKKKILWIVFWWKLVCHYTECIFVERRLIVPGKCLKSAKKRNFDYTLFTYSVLNKKLLSIQLKFQIKKMY